MSSPGCPDSAQIEAFTGGALDTPRAEVVGAHIAMCHSCAAVAWPTLSRTHRHPVAGHSSPPAPTEHYVQRVGEDGLEVELGRGGIGRVLLVSDAHLGRDVAMKVLLPRRLEDPAVVHGLELRFVREARVTGQLEHPAIVPVYEMGRRPDGSLYYVMRQIRGRTLASAVESAAGLEERLKLLPRVLAVCQAIAFAHSRHVVHRDLKPQNVMLDRFGETYVVDWGLASVRGQPEPERGLAGLPSDDAGRMRLTPELTMGVEHLVIGTPAYMSPEQASGDIAQVDELSDVWGLGAILYEVITGKLPRRSLNAPVQPVLEVEPAAPPELAAICSKALAPDRAQRYPSAEALATDLDAWVHGQRVEAYVYGPLELLRRFASQYRAPLAVGLAAVLALLVLGVGSWRRVRFERDEARELAQLVFGDLGRQLTPVPGSGPVVDSVTQRAVTFYERVLVEQDVPMAEREAMAMAVVRLAELNSTLGRSAEALRLGALCNQLTAPVEGVTRTQQLLSSAIHCELGLATVCFKQGKMAEAEQHLVEAERRVALGSPEWSDLEWLRVQSGLIARRFQVAWATGDTERAKDAATREVAIDEKIFAARPDRIEAAEGLASSLGDVSMVLLAMGDNKGGLAAGDRAITLLHGMKDLQNSAHALARLAASLSQQAYALAMARGDPAQVKALQQEGIETYERLLHLEPGMASARHDYGVLLIRAGEAQRAYEQLTRSNDEDQLNELVMAALLAGHPEVVLGHRKALEAKAEHRGLMVLALALVATGDLREGAKIARDAGREDDPIVEWPSATMHAYVSRASAPSRAVLERFATEYDEVFIDDAKTWRGVMEHLAEGLEAL